MPPFPHREPEIKNRPTHLAQDGVPARLSVRWFVTHPHIDKKPKFLIKPPSASQARLADALASLLMLKATISIAGFLSNFFLLGRPPDQSAPVFRVTESGLQCGRRKNICGSFTSASKTSSNTVVLGCLLRMIDGPREKIAEPPLKLKPPAYCSKGSL
jgi:hypothetical protein